MVTSNQPPPQSNAKDILRAVRAGPPKCVVCDTDVLGSKRMAKDNQMRWCEPCKSFQVTYRGPQRAELCHSCFNCVGTSKANGRPLCAALKFQMPDGTWRDRYNQATRDEFVQGGMDKIRHLVKPEKMTTPQFTCECYERLEDGETRESIRVNDPLRFYDRSRFFDY